MSLFDHYALICVSGRAGWGIAACYGDSEKEEKNM